MTAYWLGINDARTPIVRVTSMDPFRHMPFTVRVELDVDHVTLYEAVPEKGTVTPYRTIPLASPVRLKPGTEAQFAISSEIILLADVPPLENMP